MFEKARELSRRHEELIEGRPGANRFVSAAIEERLDQLDLIVQMVRDRQNEYRSFDLSAVGTQAFSEEDARRSRRVAEEIELLAVAFYYFANAIVTIIEKNPLPLLDRPDAGRIGFVRNRLLEHARPDPEAPFARVSLPLDPRGPRFTKQMLGIGMETSGYLFENGEKFAVVLGDLFEHAVAAAERGAAGTE